AAVSAATDCVFFVLVPWLYLKNALPGSAWDGNAFCFWGLSIASGIGERLVSEACGADRVH
ncbi:hypothetical protein L195_g054899, partial [Trifolium pratense]